MGRQPARPILDRPIPWDQGGPRFYVADGGDQCLVLDAVFCHRQCGIFFGIDRRERALLLAGELEARLPTPYEPEPDLVTRLRERMLALAPSEVGTLNI